MRLRLRLQPILFMFGVQAGWSLTPSFQRRQFIDVMIGSATAGFVMTPRAGADDITLLPVELTATGDSKKVRMMNDGESLLEKSHEQLTLFFRLLVLCASMFSCSMKVELWKVKEIWQQRNVFIPKSPKYHQGYVPDW